MQKKPFNMDPSHTAAFARLNQELRDDIAHSPEENGEGVVAKAQDNGCANAREQLSACGAEQTRGHKSLRGKFSRTGRRKERGGVQIPDDFSAVVIGGGTGAPVSIRTLLAMGIKTDAVVAMADDGGSTGRLRESADVTPPGDIRKCIAAFAADPYDPLVKAFKYRFSIADNHALGNLMLAALEDACGSFTEAIEICERMVDARGHVYPSTLDHIKLVAKTRDGRELDGQAVACHSKTALESISLQCANGDGVIHANRHAIEAIEAADLVVLGPGSLFTSILAALQVPGIIDAIARSHASVVFVCSVADTQGETWGLSAYEHFSALCAAGLEGLIDYMVVHTATPLRADSLGTRSANAIYEAADDLATNAISADSASTASIRPTAIDYKDMMKIQSMGPVVVARNLADPATPSWHNPTALRDAFMQVLTLMDARRSR